MQVPAFRLVAEPLTPEAAELTPFRWAGPDVGHRHRIGGEAPVAPQEFPRCSSCGESMSFYGQLDSLNDEIVLADVGVVAVFLCFDCGEADALIAST